MKIAYAEGWSPQRILRHKYWGFKGTSKFISKLALGQVVKRHQNDGQIISCSPSAVHIAYSPLFPWIRWRNGYIPRNSTPSGGRRHFYIAIMNPRKLGSDWDTEQWKGLERVFATAIFRMSDSGSERYLKLSGAAYTVVAKVTLSRGESYPTRGEVRDRLLQDTR